MEALGTAPRELRRAILKAIADRDKELATAIEYMLRERSVGTLVARMELRARGVRNPDKVMAVLREVGLVEVRPGCYNLARPVREWVINDGGTINHVKKVFSEFM